MKELSFSAAIFDLDGTLLDSLYVWRLVDERFFGTRNLELPEDYARAVSGMSFGETVAYTKARFHLPDAPEDIVAEWEALAAEEYALRVPLLPGGGEYLRLLQRRGVRLAAATANRRSLFMPALERCGAAKRFDAILTTGDLGDGNKSDGALFRAAAQQLGVAPGDCVVFEDSLEGLRGARAAGMRAVGVRSRALEHCINEASPLCECMIDDYRALLPRCVIFTARCEGDPRAAFRPEAEDYVLCADGGWHIAEAAGVRPAVVVGDFDSSQMPSNANVRRFPVEKDDTDTMLCLKQGLARGYLRFLIVGGFGGRLDHTMANLQSLNYAAAHGAQAEMSDGRSWATVIRGGSVMVPRRPGKLSVFALDTVCRGVRIRGAKYEADDLELTSAFPLGMGNDFTRDFALISASEGALLVLVNPE